MRLAPALCLTFLALALTACAPPVSLPRVGGQDAALKLPLQVVRQALDTLRQRYVEKPDDRQLLGGAEDGLREALRAAGWDQVHLNTLPYNGDPDVTWQNFDDYFSATLKQAGPRANATQAAQMVVRGMAASLHDSNTRLLDPEQLKEREQSQGGTRYAGVGMRVHAVPGGLPVVVEVFSGGPAAEAGVRVGDAITRVGADETQASTVSQVVQKIRGPVGTSVTIGLRRPGSSNEVSVSLVRREIQVTQVESRDLGGGKAYLLIRSFGQSTATAADEAINRLQEQGARGLVLDLRGNAQGDPQVMARVLERFVPNGPVAYFVDREGNRQSLQVEDSRNPIRQPIAVLVDGETASSAEIFAAVLKVRRSAHIIGTPTAGAVGVAEPFPLADGSQLDVTTKRAQVANGPDLWRQGIKPDDVVESFPADLQQGRDAPLLAAQKFLDSP